ncbi:hypothetical protein [Aerococcus urinae]|uniref:hypothetical protein n=1 Tax=Aerococcus urinae TaxID=1376 RepID=UPI00254C85D4|nr:hypothetical protein [Aerococcus urinae]MDK8379090.1 hypothetical protein [Aerococcus urinae]MDK8840760.1 hypothetical protein [Aerococcus urinae]
MTKAMKSLEFHFHNGGVWEIPMEHVGDIWIGRITTSYGRINGQGDIVEIHPCKTFKIEILPDADVFQSNSIVQGGLMGGMFENVVNNNDLEYLTIRWSSGRESEIYFPFKAPTTDKVDNVYMSSKVKDNGNLYIVINREATVDDIFE